MREVFIQIKKVKLQDLITKLTLIKDPKYCMQF